MKFWKIAVVWMLVFGQPCATAEEMPVPDTAQTEETQAAEDVSAVLPEEPTDDEPSAEELSDELLEDESTIENPKPENPEPENPEPDEIILTDRDMTGAPIERVRLNYYRAEAYDGDVTTDHQFSATWDITARDGEPAQDGAPVPDGGRLIAFTGKPELYDIELGADTLTVSQRTAPWDMEVTDTRMSDLWHASVNQTVKEPWNSVGEQTPEHAANAYMTAYVTTENGDNIPLRTVWVYQFQGNGNYGYTYTFDRSITEEAVTFTVDFHLPPTESDAETSE